MPYVPPLRLVFSRGDWKDAAVSGTLPIIPVLLLLLGEMGKGLGLKLTSPSWERSRNMLFLPALNLRTHRLLLHLADSNCCMQSFLLLDLDLIRPCESPARVNRLHLGG